MDVVTRNSSGYNSVKMLFNTAQTAIAVRDVTYSINLLRMTLLCDMATMLTAS